MLYRLEGSNMSDLEEGFLTPIPEGDDETQDIPEKTDYSWILNRRTAAVVGSVALGLIGAWNIAIGVDASLFRSPDNPNLKPAITAHEIIISRGLYGTSGVFLVAASILTLSSAFFDEVPKKLKSATTCILCCGTLFEAVPLVFLF